MKKRVIYCLFTVMILCLMSSVVLADSISDEKVTEIEDMIQKNMDRFNVPGMSFVLVTEDDVILNKGYGVQELDSDHQVNADTIMGLASVSKAFTSWGILKLRNEDKLELSDPVVKHLPWFATKNKEKSDKIKIIHLLHHTSGFPRAAYGLEIENGTEDDLEEQIKKASQIKLYAEPGKDYQYSNINYWTLALIIEKISGMKFADYMKSNFFEPLDMERTGYYKHISEMENKSLGHRVRYAKPEVFDYHLPTQTNAAGGLYSTANDMGNYLQALLNDGFYNETEIISANSIEDAWYDIVKHNDKNGYGYGWFHHKWRGEMVIEHGGDNPNFTAHVYILPRKKVAFALLSNSQHTVTHKLAMNISDFIFDWDINPIKRTPTEARAGLSRIINYVAIGLCLILLVWIFFAYRKVKQGSYVVFKKPGIVRMILQAILIPVVGIVAAIYAFKLPSQMIGSLRIAMLYQGDLVSSVIRLGIIFLIFTLFTGFMAFVGKPKDSDHDLTA